MSPIQELQRKMREMRLTPEEVQNIAFGAPPEGFLGYNPEDVDVFVDLLEDSIRLYREDIETLKERIAELESHNTAAITESTKDLSEAFPAVEPGNEKVSFLLLPHQVVQQLLAQAQGESDAQLNKFTARATQSGFSPALRPTVAIFEVEENE